MSQGKCCPGYLSRSDECSDSVNNKQTNRSVIVESVSQLVKEAKNDSSGRWPNGVVPYVTSKVYRPRDVEQLRPAMDEMTRLTNQCVRFVERTTESNHVKTGPGFGCASDIGRIGGVQTVSLAMACLFEMGDIQHELMHVLGFYHEHARVDRDNYVTVKWENIIPAQRSQFIKKNSFTFGLPYDYDSVMHYSSDAFAKDIQLTTLTSKTSPDRKQLGQHKNLSLLDVERIKKRYGCHASPGSGTGLKG